MRSTDILRGATLGAVLVALGANGWVMAQDYVYGGGYVDNRAATAGESYARGMADVARSAGAYNLATSEAAINMTEAARQGIENREQWTTTYFEMRKANRAYREAERGPRHSMEDLVRYAQAGKPSPMSPSELDSVTGGISWPPLLKIGRYDQPRGELEALFAKRATYGGLGFEDQTKLRKATSTMLASLREQIRDVPASDYMASKKFLQSLAYDAQS